ncbi:SDR family NAD(P)-dependent oxidoreductase [Dictyobacter kobayashii]|uniref:Short-chain dehydrogenase n=1 Tax=Dictyobacter kobayashii TaxID=2014872 RepID=A0A402AXY4_9CHLR|nr:SDR family oxidoreductase [Dictyobacter kobayashii]GCE23948.1 short-chain dehydrogenase [Dictyobacter kobayashii]
MDIEGKVVIITGASNGIGLSTAHLFAQKGAKVALVARSTDKLQQLATELPQSLAVTADMRDEAAIRQMIEQVQQHYGQIDVLINNAGQGMHVPIEQADPQQYRSIVELNIIGVISAMQAVIPIMRSQGGGVIINISSGTTKMVLPGVGPYASTKHALNSISLTARQELAKDNISVGLVYPGITATDFHKNAISMQQNPERRQGTMPMETPEQVAEKILEAVQTESAEVYADSLQKFANK